MRVGVDVVEPGPHVELAHLLRERQELRRHIAAAEFAGRVLEVQPIGAGILRDHEKLFRPARHQSLGLIEDRCQRAGGEVAANLRDDAERAAVVAALGNLQVRIVPRRQPQALLGEQVDELVRHRREVLVHFGDDRLILMRPRHCEDAWVRPGDQVFLDTKTARDDDAAIGADRLADGLEALLLGAVEETAGIDQHHVRALVVARELIALRTQGRHDALGVDEGLWAAEADKADLGSLGHCRGIYAKPDKNQSSRCAGLNCGAAT